MALLVQTDATATAGKYYVLTKDIRLNDTSAEDWKQSATPWIQSDNSFRGQLDGQGHVVEGLFIDADVTTTTRAGLFCFIGPGAVVKNVGIVKADLKAKLVGSIAAYIEHMDGTPPRISGCFAASSVKIQGADVGGLSDIKRVLAFSTISQIGFMIVALGVCTSMNPHEGGLGYMASMFHLLSLIHI